MDRLSSSCIYTLLDSGRLREQAKEGVRHELTERNKPWRRGSQLWAEAERAGDRMAIVFAGIEREGEFGEDPQRRAAAL